MNNTDAIEAGGAAGFCFDGYFRKFIIARENNTQPILNLLFTYSFCDSLDAVRKSA